MPPLTNRFRRCFALFQRVTYASLPLVVGKEIATTAEPLPEGGKRQVHTAKARSLITTRRISANRDDPRRSFWMVHTKKILLIDGFVFCFNEAYQPQRFRFSPTLFYCSKPFLKKTFQPHRRPQPKTSRSVVPLVVHQHTQALDSNLIHGAKGCLMRVRPRRSIRTSNSSTPGQGRA